MGWTLALREISSVSAAENLMKQQRIGLCRDFSGKVIAIFVKDSGPGISEEVSADQSQIFRAFVSTKVSGSGLGLAVARDLVESQGGVIMIDSLSSKGTTVGILLPIREAIPCWEQHNARAVDCPLSRELDCANCDVNSSGTGYCCWTVKGTGVFCGERQANGRMVV